MRYKDNGPGGHILTGPIFIEGAQPGDVLEVRIQKTELAVPWAMKSFRSTIRLDRDRMVGMFGNGIEIPLRPFFGSMGVSPPAKGVHGMISKAIFRAR